MNFIFQDKKLKNLFAVCLVAVVLSAVLFYMSGPKLPLIMNEPEAILAVTDSYATDFGTTEINLILELLGDGDKAVIYTGGKFSIADLTSRYKEAGAAVYDYTQEIINGTVTTLDKYFIVNGSVTAMSEGAEDLLYDWMYANAGYLIEIGILSEGAEYAEEISTHMLRVDYCGNLHIAQVYAYFTAASILLLAAIVIALMLLSKRNAVKAEDGDGCEGGEAEMTAGEDAVESPDSGLGQDAEADGGAEEEPQPAEEGENGGGTERPWETEECEGDSEAEQDEETE